MRRSYCNFLQLGEFGATLIFARNILGKTQTIPTAIMCQWNGRNEFSAGMGGHDDDVVVFLICARIFKSN
jgi:ABC-type molybdate transport system permease subunit